MTTLKNMKAWVVIFILKEEVDIMWVYLRNVKGIREKELEWRMFEKYFREKYLSKRYYERKIKYLHEHQLGNISID